MRSKLPLLWLWVLSLGLRALFLGGMQVGEGLRSDASFYVPLAWNLANHGRYSASLRPPLEPHLRFPPGYPLLLAPFFAGRDGSVEAGPALRARILAGAVQAQRAQVLVGSLLPVLVVLLGRRLMSPLPAWVAGLLTACCPVLVTTCGFLVTEAAFSVILLVTLLGLGRLLERPTLPAALAAGALCGYLALMRGFALLLPAAVALHLGARGLGPARRRAAAVLLATAGALLLPWFVRNRILIARGHPPGSYLAQAIAQSLYPDLEGGRAPRGLAHLVDPDFPQFSTSIPQALAELRRRVAADPARQLRWYLVGRWLTLWEFHQIGAPPIHVHQVRNGLFRPARLNPAGRAEPLAALYWVFRGLYYVVVPAVLLGAVGAARRWRAEPTTASRTRELLYVVLAYTAVVNGAILPLPRYLWPVRPLLYLLALSSLLDLVRLGRSRGLVHRLRQRT